MLLGSQLSNKLSPDSVALSRPFSGAEKTEDMKILRMWVQKSGNFDEILPGTRGRLPPSLLEQLMTNNQPRSPQGPIAQEVGTVCLCHHRWPHLGTGQEEPQNAHQDPPGKSKEPDCFTAKTPTYAHGLGHENFHPSSWGTMWLFLGFRRAKPQRWKRQSVLTRGAIGRLGKGLFSPQTSLRVVV